MNRDSTKPQSTKPSDGADGDGDAGVDGSVGTQSDRDGPPGGGLPVASMWLRTPEDVLARIPFAIGYHPGDSLVVIAVNANGRSDLVVRADLPAAHDLSPPSPTDHTAAPRATPGATGNAEPAPAIADADATVPGEAESEPAIAVARACAAAATAAGRAASAGEAELAPATTRADTAATTAVDVAATTAQGDVEPTTAAARVGTAAATAVGRATAAPGDGDSAITADAGATTANGEVTASGDAESEAAIAVAVPGAATATAVDVATAGFGRITTDHSTADHVLPAQPGRDSAPNPSADDWPDFAHQLAAAMVHNGAKHSVLVAYTASSELARHSTEILAAALAASGIGLLDALWVDGSRWRSLSCLDPLCCPAEGRPYDAQASRVAAESIYHGNVALSGEPELRRSIAPARGLSRLAMRRATARMDAEASRRYLRVEDDKVQVASAVQADGKAYVLRLVDRYLADGKPPTEDEVAWAGMYLYDIQVRDAAWIRMTTRTAQQHVQLWREIGRRALPPYHVAPLALLAFAAWLSGDGPLARCAVDRVLASDATYSMAHLIRNVVAAMVPPSVWPPDDWPAESGEAGEARQGQAD